MEKQELEALIRAAFEGITLGHGMSLRQADICDNYGVDSSGKKLNNAEFLWIKRLEITEDWTTLTLEYIQTYCYRPYLDAEGFRYYIPALMLLTLDGYDVGSAGVLPDLYPQKGELEDFYLAQYFSLNAQQQHAVAQFLRWLPHFVALSKEETIITERALRNYWGQFLTIELREGKRKVKSKKKRQEQQK